MSNSTHKINFGNMSHFLANNGSAFENNKF